MIDDNTAEKAALYVLGLLKDEELREFELALQESDELRRHVRELSAGLHEPLKSVAASPRPELLAGVLSRIDSPSSSETLPSEASIPATREAAPFPWSYFWGAAAVLFLGLNLFLLVQVNSRDESASGLPGAALNSPADTAGQTATPESELAGGDARTVLSSRIQRLEEQLNRARDDLESYEIQRQQLLRENDEVREFNSEWQREYALLAARFLPFFESDDGMSRFTVIEMVDAEAFEQGLPRRGFADLAGQFLTGEGNIAGIDPSNFVGPVVEGAGAAVARLDPGRPGLSPVGGPPMQAAPDAATDSSAASPDDPLSARPTGFTVWRDDEQKGFLDLYNLPEAPEGREAFLWVRSSELEAYIPVGNLPSLDNGTGSLFYSVEEPNFTPSEILITAEAEGGASVMPSGAVLLRGP